MNASPTFAFVLFSNLHFIARSVVDRLASLRDSPDNSELARSASPVPRYDPGGLTSGCARLYSIDRSRFRRGENAASVSRRSANGRACRGIATVACRLLDEVAPACHRRSVASLLGQRHAAIDILTLSRRACTGDPTY